MNKTNSDKNHTTPSRTIGPTDQATPNSLLHPSNMILVPKLSLKLQSPKIQSLAEDLARLEIDPPWQNSRGCATVATFQKKGSLDKLEDGKRKWRPFMFVLRDCEWFPPFLLLLLFLFFIYLYYIFILFIYLYSLID